MSRTETPAIFNLDDVTAALRAQIDNLSLIHISEPTRPY